MGGPKFFINRIRRSEFGLRPIWDVPTRRIGSGKSRSGRAHQNWFRGQRRGGKNGRWSKPEPGAPSFGRESRRSNFGPAMHDPCDRHHPKSAPRTRWEVVTVRVLSAHVLANIELIKLGTMFRKCPPRRNTPYCAGGAREPDDEEGEEHALLDHRGGVPAQSREHGGR